MNELKPKEVQILILSAEGLTAIQISPEVHLAPRTVQVYRQILCQKLGADNMYQAITIGFRTGIIS